MKKTILVFLMFIFLFSSVYAFEFDNVMSYNNETRIATFKNTFGLGKVIGQARLISNLNVNVPRGYGEVARFQLWAFDDYNDAIKQFTFDDMNNGRVKINRDYDLKILTYKNVTYPFYYSDCYNVTNSSGIVEKCDLIENGTFYRTAEVWTKVTPADLKKNEIVTIGVFTDVQKGDYVDWIPTIFGVEVEQWATWTENLNTGLFAYYEFEDLTDSIGSNDLTNNGAVNDSGKIGSGFYFDGVSDYFYDNSFLKNFSDGLTISVWFKSDATPDAYGGFVYLEDGSSQWQIINRRSASNNYIETNSRGGGLVSASGSQLDGNWHHMVMTRNDTHLQLYLDGSYIGADTSFTDIYTDAEKLEIGRSEASNSYSWKGWLDEVGIWERVLNSSEITDLYNSGDGITYVSCMANYTNTSWSSWEDYGECQPANYYQQRRSLLQYDVNGCDGSTNTTFYDYQNAFCDYCTPNSYNSSWSGWINNGSCMTSDEQQQVRNLTNYDNNTCYAITGLGSDSYSNTTFYDFQNISCNYCSYSVVNSSWSDWLNSSCYENDTLSQSRNLTSYDQNYSSCYSLTNIASDLWNSGSNLTFFTFQSASCDYCTPNLVNSSWSSWANDTLCNSSGFLEQSRYLVEYDNNYCNEVSNYTHFQNQTLSCTYYPCVNAPTNTTWSNWSDVTACQSNNLTQQIRSLVTYDLNESYCANFTNITFYDYQNAPCVYVESIANQFSFNVDFSKDINIYLLFFSFAVAITLFFFKHPKWTAFIFLIDGFILLISRINIYFTIGCFIASIVFAGLDK